MTRKRQHGKCRRTQKYVDAIGRLAANPSGRTLVIPIETGALAGGVTQAIEAMRLGRDPPG
jgi:hypothetical protein